MAPVEGVPKINALGSAGMLLLSGICAMISLTTPWWTGNSQIGRVADDLAVRADATLWSFDLGVAKPDPEDITQSIIVPETISWDEMCAAKDQTAEEAPVQCMMVMGVRAFVCLTLIGDAFAAGLLVVAVKYNVLGLLPAAFLAGFTGAFAMFGMVGGMAMSTSGLTGPGVGALMAASLLSFGGAAFGIYAAVNAMKEMEPNEPHIARQLRAEEARRKDEDEAAQLEEGMKQSKHSSHGGSDSPKKKAPVMLTKVLFWSQNHDNAGQQIPTALLEASFREIDHSGDGTIDATEFCEALQMCGLPVSQAIIDTVMLEIDKNASGDIDIHEYVEFFRNIEELGDFEQKSEQQAQFLSFICNCCFLIHIVLFSVLLLNYINMGDDANADSKLIFQNLLFGVAMVLAFLLIVVIILPAIRLTMGPSLAQWQKAYEFEKAKRLKKKKQPAQQDSGGAGNLRNAAWTSGDQVNPVTTRVPVNTAVHGASYRTSKMNAQSQMGLDTVNPYQEELTQRPRLGDNQFDVTGSDGFGGESRGGQRDAGAVIEKYDPNAYRYAAMLAIEARQASSFSPMQVRDLDVSPEMPAQQPGAMPALTGGTY